MSDTCIGVWLGLRPKGRAPVTRDRGVKSTAAPLWHAALSHSHPEFGERRV